jgi:multiple sugar transport system permease protein
VRDVVTAEARPLLIAERPHRGLALGRRTTLRVMLAPAIVWILGLAIFPLLYSLYLSFTSRRLGGSTGEWVGFDNFSQAFSDPRFVDALQFTAVFTVASVSIEMVLGLALALLLDTVTRARGTVRTIWTLPLFATPVAIAYLALTMFNEDGGFVNSALDGLGLGRVPWLSSPDVAPLTIILLDVWQWTPFVVLILFAALQSIPTDIAEAARVDGATTGQFVRTLVLPLLTPALLTVLFLRIADSVKMFDFAFALTGGGPGTSTEPASLYVFRQALDGFRLGYGSALAYILFAASILVGAFILAWVRRVTAEGGVAR